MEQTDRIKLMEQYLDRSSAAVMRLSAALDDYEAARADIEALSEYYGSAEWKADFADDEQGRLPKDLKRGVLSEDGIWNLLSDCRDIEKRMAELKELGVRS